MEKYNTVYKKFKLTSINFYFILFISISLMKYIYSQGPEDGSNPNQDEDIEHYSPCELNPSINNQECFNYVLKFNQKDFLLNSIASNKNEDFLIQYNEYLDFDELNSSRFFYGASNSRKYFFSNKTFFSSEFNIEINDEIFEDSYFSNIYFLEDSKNLFVSIKNDINKKKQYLFSINAYDSLVELYDLNNNNYLIWSFNKFFNLDEDEYVFPFKYEIFELKEISEYIIAELLNTSFIKKFKFNSFDDNAYEELSSVNYDIYCQNIIMDVFFMDNTKTLTVLTLKKIIEEVEGELKYECPSYENQDHLEEYYEYELIMTLKFYSQNLNYLSYFKEVRIESELFSYISEFYEEGGEEGHLFIKSLNIIISNKPYIFFIFNDYIYFYFDLIGINILDFINKEYIETDNEGNLEQEIYDFDPLESSNDLIQIDDNKVVFIYASHKPNSFIYGLGIIITNIIFEEEEFYYEDELYCEFYAKYFYINFENYSPTRIKALNYNGFILFASSGIINTQDYFNNKEYLNSYLSMFMVFGYANGTDTIIDISKFLFKDNNRLENNFFTFLYKNFTIENNIFGYRPFNLIKLVSVPKEITIYEYNLQTHVKTLLEDSLMISGCIDYTINNAQCDYDYLLEENENLIKTSQYYYIDYQYCVSYYDPELEEYFPQPQEEEPQEPTDDNKLSRLNIKSYSDIYPGRINRLKFKLCHDYCEMS